MSETDIFLYLYFVYRFAELGLDKNRHLNSLPKPDRPLLSTSTYNCTSKYQNANTTRPQERCCSPGGNHLDSRPRLHDRRVPGKHRTSNPSPNAIANLLKFGSVSILAHMILALPHPFVFSAPSPPAYPATQPRPRPSIFSRDYLRSRLFHRPLEGFSSWISPGSRVYRGPVSYTHLTLPTICSV